LTIIIITRTTRLTNHTFCFCMKCTARLIIAISKSYLFTTITNRSIRVLVSCSRRFSKTGYQSWMISRLKVKLRRLVICRVRYRSWGSLITKSLRNSTNMKSILYGYNFWNRYLIIQTTRALFRRSTRVSIFINRSTSNRSCLYLKNSKLFMKMGSSSKRN